MTGIQEETRLIAIGDIHGHSKALRSLLKWIDPKPKDQVITLGDYVDRGPDSKGVVEALVELKERCQLFPILGNHDEMMLESRRDTKSKDRWLYHGGKETLRSYGIESTLENIPDDHWGFLDECLPNFETEAFIFTHANYEWYSTMEDQPASLLRWISIEESEPKPHISGKKVILGHSPGPVRDNGFYCCIDTGCGFGGNLTAVELNSGTIWQVNENGTSLGLDYFEK